MRADNCWYIDWVKPKGMRGKVGWGVGELKRPTDVELRNKIPTCVKAGHSWPSWTILSHVCGCITEKLIGPCSMSGMLSSVAVVLSQNTPLWGCSYMQRHLSGQQRGRTCLWSPSCHLWLGSWPWNSLWYTERPGKQQMKVKLILKKGGRAAQGPPPHLCVHKQKRLGQTWKSFTSKEFT